MQENHAVQGVEVRPYVIEEYTTTVCPLCFAERQRRADEEGVFIDGMLVSHDGSVWMRRFCPVHGETESLYEEDVEIWRARNGWATPTLGITPDRPGNFKGFPDGYLDGLPASHGQHTVRANTAIPQYRNTETPQHPTPQYPNTAKKAHSPLAR